jgi:uncharacterized Zn finger protein (UPF0148 family)
LAAIGTLWLCTVALALAGMLATGVCPECGRPAFVWRGRLWCPRCYKERDAPGQ